jgi:hypothetical protein
MDTTYTQIDVDFDVWKAITVRRTSPEISENSVLRNLLGIGEEQANEQARVAPSGVWVTKRVQFPIGTEFRATHKGAEHLAVITSDGIEYNGVTYKYASGAARAVTGTQVNGWRFWECRRPGGSRWTLIDDLYKQTNKKK